MGWTVEALLYMAKFGPCLLMSHVHVTNYRGVNGVFLGLQKWRKDVAIMPSEYALMEIKVWSHSVFTKKTCSSPSRQQTDDGFLLLLISRKCMRAPRSSSFISSPPLPLATNLDFTAALTSSITRGPSKAGGRAGMHPLRPFYY